jgi:Fe(3+) dicitrate transport protein
MAGSADGVAMILGYWLAGAACGLASAATAEAGQEHRPIVVTGPNDDTPPKLDHILREVDGTRITVTKKSSVTKLDQQPTIVNNNQRELFVRTPGVSVSEQQTPTQYNLSYRGIGNPQEAEYVLVLRDGLPIMSDWIGFPTLFYMPLPQSLAEVQTIRGGSSLIYGPEPAPAINLVSRRPDPNGPSLTGSTEHALGSDGLYSTYDVVQGASGKWAWRADLGYVRSGGARRNNASSLFQGDLYLAWRPDASQLWSIEYNGHGAEAGDAGRISKPQFDADPSFSPTPQNHNWVRRHAVTLAHERDFGKGWRFEGKAFATRQQLYSRAAAAQAAGAPPPATTTLQDERINKEGVDLSQRKPWGRGNAFTAGTVLYHSDAPFLQFTSPNLLAQRGEHSGVPRLAQARDSYYGALFAENVFRLPGRFHIVLSGRLEHERLRIVETAKPANLTRPLVDVDVSRTVPLFGIGIGSDFGRDNETYLSVTQGYRPLRFFDVASPFSNLQPGHDADPSRSLSIEAGVHGTPLTGLFYDASLFWIEFRNRIETQRLNATDVINVNTGDTRHRGFEGALAYDFLAGSRSDRHLSLFANLSLLDAKFTASSNPAQVGKRPAYAPKVIAKGGVTARRDGHYRVSLTASAVSSQFFQVSNLPVGAGATLVPAKIPAYQLVDLSADIWVLRGLRLLGGVSNLLDERYYSRVFQTGLEPGLGRKFYLGAAFDF